jgi:NodT family efflux transporter outer membrane factor (OMF) lipoprotein
MKNKLTIIVVLLTAAVVSCKIPLLTGKQENSSVPEFYSDSTDTTNVAAISWRQYFADPHLIALIDSALGNNQELSIALLEIEVDKNEIQARKGEYLPFVNFGAVAGADKTGRYTWDGLSEEDLKANPDKGPKHIGEFMLGATASWELDVWKKLRNAKKSAVLKYLSTIEGRNFMVTNLIAEISSSYYELLALDNLMDMVQQNIEIQKNALRVVRLQKEAAKVTELAVIRFEAQLLHTENLQYDIRQRIVQTENRINFLAGRYPQPVARNVSAFNDMAMDHIRYGIPSQLLSRRPDIRQAELDLSATKLDIQVAKANFLPSIRLTSGLGFVAFNPLYILKPESILYNLAGDLVAPLVNRNAIKATYSNANLKQVMAAFNYERSILNAYVEVVNELSKMENFARSFETKNVEVDKLTQSIDISNKLFSSARADYMEVLLTQREVLNSRIELIEIKKKQLETKVNLYKVLGGGWK